MFTKLLFLGGMSAAMLAGLSPPGWSQTSPDEVGESAPDVTDQAPTQAQRPPARDFDVPAARWGDDAEHQRWTMAALAAVQAHGSALLSTIPRDIGTWCPAYSDNAPRARAAFWVGMISALSYHESRYQPHVVGGGNAWFGLVQISPPTARGYGCDARTGQALKDPLANLSCAIRIMAVTVPRDQAVALHDGRWRGVAADWGPMTSAAKRRDMAGWTSQQSYCLPEELVSVPRPPARPERATEITTEISTEAATD